MSKLDSLKKPYQDKSSHGKKKSHSAQKADESTSKPKLKDIKNKNKKKPG